jgi:hypothetical protein
MSKLCITAATALSLALAVATPAFAGPGGVGMYLGNGGLRGAQASIDSVASSARISHCRQRWAYYDQASGKYMDDGGQWHPCL